MRPFLTANPFSLARMLFKSFRDGLGADIAGHKRVEADLQNALAVQKAITDSAAYAIISNAPGGIIKSWNPAAQKMLGYTAEEMIDRQSPAIFHDPDEVAVRAGEFSLELGRTIAPGYEVFISKALAGLPNEHEWTYIRKDGSRFPVLLSVTVIRNSNGEITGYMGMAVDLTKRKQMETELRQAMEAAESANRAKSEFLATMSHEIRTPMNGVLGMTNLLIESGLNQDQLEMAKTMKYSGDILLNIINDILDYSKIEAGKLEIESRVFSVDAILVEVMEIMATQASEKGLDLRIELPESRDWGVVADPIRLRQVLMNLLSNAIKFTARGGVTLRAAKADGVMKLAVIDTGIGIAENKRDRIFRRFSQADASTTRKFGGTGLGLAISARLVELMGGVMGFDSSEGQGSHFWLTLPLPAKSGKEEPIDLSVGGKDRGEKNRGGDKTAVNGLPDPSWVPVFPALAGLRVLLAEDNVVNQKVALRFLKKMECEVGLAQNGREAVAMAQKNHYQVILMDCQMPEMDGFEATQAIRQWEAEREAQGETKRETDCHGTDTENKSAPANRLFIIALTAGAMMNERERCYQVGMDAFLAKPFAPEDLRKVLQQAGETRRTGA